MNIKKMVAFILLASAAGIVFSQGVEGTINEILQRFYETNQLRGGISLAISRNGRLVYIGSVGYADSRNTVRLTPDYRMRIASLSKPITRLAILKLVEDRKLSLDDFVFGRNGIFNNEYGMPTYNGNPADITIKQLMDHTGGGWGQGVWSHNIAQFLRDRPLQNPPGTNYDYSNFGFYILGRVIERKSGMTYENFVKENILKPAGIDGMRVGVRGVPSQPDEVEYIAAPGGSNPLNIGDMAMDSAGGWIASPVELLKVLNHWGATLGNNWNHGGGMSGTNTYMAKRSDGFNWVMLTNYRPPEPRYDRASIFNQIRAAISVWPTGIEF